MKKVLLDKRCQNLNIWKMVSPFILAKIKKSEENTNDVTEQQYNRYDGWDSKIQSSQQEPEIYMGIHSSKNTAGTQVDRTQTITVYQWVQRAEHCLREVFSKLNLQWNLLCLECVMLFFLPFLIFLFQNGNVSPTYPYWTGILYFSST